MNLPIIASKYPPKNRKAVWLQLDDNGGIKSIRKASTLSNITMGAKTVVSFISISDNKNIRTLD